MTESSLHATAARQNHLKFWIKWTLKPPSTPAQATLLSACLALQCLANSSLTHQVVPPPQLTGPPSLLSDLCSLLVCVYVSLCVCVCLCISVCVCVRVQV